MTDIHTVAQVSKIVLFCPTNVIQIWLLWPREQLKSHEISSFENQAWPLLYVVLKFFFLTGNIHSASLHSLSLSFVFLPLHNDLRMKLFTHVRPPCLCSRPHTQSAACDDVSNHRLWPVHTGVKDGANSFIKTNRILKKKPPAWSTSAALLIHQPVRLLALMKAQQHQMKRDALSHFSSASTHDSPWQNKLQTITYLNVVTAKNISNFWHWEGKKTRTRQSGKRVLICQCSPSGIRFMEHLSEFACKAGAKKKKNCSSPLCIFYFHLLYFISKLLISSLGMRHSRL